MASKRCVVQTKFRQIDRNCNHELNANLIGSVIGQTEIKENECEENSIEFYSLF